MTDAAKLLEQGREAYHRRDWVTARRMLTQAVEAAPPRPDDLYALANCDWWLGDLDRALGLQEQAYQAYLAAGEPRSSALVAIDIGYTLSMRGDHARGSGWLGRAQRLLADLPESAEHGYLVYLDFESALEAWDLDTASDAAAHVQRLGRRLGDPTLTALGVLGQGRVLVRRGEVTIGMALLDEAMLAAVSDGLDPTWAGNIYCHLMTACFEIADLRRAGEWTDATERWCETMPGAGPFTGICRVHRAQILHVRGAWDDAEREAVHVVEELSDFDTIIVAEAHYLRGELRRQRGDLAGAEEAFRESHRLGRDPQPGLALLRLTQGDARTAAASLRSALAARSGDTAARAQLLPAAVEVALAAGDVAQARTWCDELAAAADRFGTSALAAAARWGRGAVLLAEDDAAQAVGVLRESLRLLHELDAPYEAARVRLLLARACESLGDHDAAALERGAAESGFARLGIILPPPADRGRGDRDGLTRREREVLALVAQGLSNQEVAAELVLSVRTVERHLATVYQKLGLQGRSARAGAVSHALRAGLDRDATTAASPNRTGNLRGGLRASTQGATARRP